MKTFVMLGQAGILGTMLSLAACGGPGHTASPAPPPSDGSYPPGPYGFAQGDTLPNMHFQGYRGGVAPWTDIALSDYYDPTGKRGIRALYATIGKELCGACVEEANNMNTWYMTDNPGTNGVYLLSALIRGPKEELATQESIDAWVASYHPSYDIVADPQSQLNDMVELTDPPRAYVIDPRTMKIFFYFMGGPSTYFFHYETNKLLNHNP